MVADPLKKARLYRHALGRSRTTHPSPRSGENMKEAWKSLRRLLAIRLDAMGDVLMTTPALRAIKETHPKSHLTFLTSPEGAEIARLVPEIDEIWTYQAPWVKASPQRSITKKDSRSEENTSELQ